MKRYWHNTLGFGVTAPTDPQSGGPYVMWKGTPYAHLMVPIGSRDE